MIWTAFALLGMFFSFLSLLLSIRECNREMTGNICSSLFDNLSSPPLPLSRLLCTEENCASYYLYLYLCYLHLYLCDLYLYFYLFDNLSLPRLPLSRLLCKGGGGELCIKIFVLFAFNRIFWPLLFRRCRDATSTFLLATVPCNMYQ